VLFAESADEDGHHVAEVEWRAISPAAAVSASMQIPRA
jgi:hypothetical protein